MNFNHAMIYSRDVAQALTFYRDRLGFILLEEFVHHGMTVYARLQSPGSDSTIALHLLERGATLQTGGVRLYFEIRDLDRAVKRLEKAGVQFTKLPAMMPWGWKHAYLNDPDGHEISLYWAGKKRLQKAKPAANV
jgi:catechol 2,3-dioxygenase-like lactoylglutathione lyase family enzyme